MPTDLIFRRATRADLFDVVRLLADDALGATREELVSPLPASYEAAFDAIASDPNNELIVVEANGKVVATMQLTFVPSISRRGAWRVQLEAVRVDSAHRGSGLGRQMVTWAMERGRSRGCRVIQLTSDKSRTDAIRFYESLGFVASHQGMKREL